MNSKLTITSAQRQQGLSLVELMIAMTLGLFLIWGVTQSFLTSRHVYDMQNAVSQIQENTRLAQEFMAFDLRNAGDYGCASGDRFLRGAADIRNDAANCTVGAYPAITSTTTGINMIQSNTSVDDEFQYAVYGFDNVTTANLAIGATAIGSLNPAPKNLTDVLMVHTATEIGVLSTRIPDDGANIPPKLRDDISSLALATGIAKPLLATDRISVSDCATTKIFALDAAIAAGAVAIPLSASASTNYCRTAAFWTGASVRKLSTVYYYVATNRDDANGQPIYSLFRAEGNFTATAVEANELLEGVEDLQLEFGVDTDGDGNIDIYKDWSDAPKTPTEADMNGWDWVSVAPAHPEPSMVRAVRYHLLMASGGANLMADNQQRVMFFGTEYVGGVALPTATGRDRKLRQVVSSTVGIRSRVR